MKKKTTYSIMKKVSAVNVFLKANYSLYQKLMDQSLLTSSLKEAFLFIPKLKMVRVKALVSVATLVLKMHS